MFDRQWVFNIDQHNEYVDFCRNKCIETSFIDEIMYKRKYTGAAGDISGLSDPYILPDMDKAVDIILAAIEDCKRIAVFGDYDADGVTAVTVLYHFLHNIVAADVICYIPDRLTEGYGMSVSAIDKLAKQDVSLIVTVDNGIVAFDEIDYAVSLGIDVVVTDHHKCAEHLPKCCAVVDPCILQDETPAQSLCGAGVAFALVRALSEALGYFEETDRYVPIVMLGTLGDIVPLTGDNRIIVKYGMEHLLDCGWTGIEKLVAKISENRQTPLNITSAFISFQIVPKLNSAGRLGNALRAFELLMSESPSDAARLAEELILENTKRQEAEAEIASKAVQEENLKSKDTDAVVVALGRNWHHGVIGIVASRLTEKYGKPSFVLSEEENNIARGSARSVKGFDLHKALSSCSDLLERFGGHEMAAGLSLRTENIERFINAMNTYANEVSCEISEPPNIEIDAVAEPEELTLENVSRISELEPYGTGNPEPVICVRNINVLSCAKVGDGGKHLKITFGAKTSGGRELLLDGIAFSQGGYEHIIAGLKNGVCSVVCRLQINQWMGKKSVSLLVMDIHDEDYNIDKKLKCVYNSHYITNAGFAVSRETLAVMYKQLINYGDGFKFSDLYQVREQLKRITGIGTWYEIRLGLDVFTELRLIERIDKQNFKLVKRRGKTDLSSSRIYLRSQTEG